MGGFSCARRAHRTATAPTSPPDGSGPQQRLFVAAASACEPLRGAAHTTQDEMIYRFWLKRSVDAIQS